MNSKSDLSFNESSTNSLSPPRKSPEKRLWMKKEAENILAHNIQSRIKAKEDLFLVRMQREKMLNDTRELRLKKWVERTKHSPFSVNLVAEDERISEENKIRMREEQTRRNDIQKRKEKAKNEIIVKALSEFSDLEALRKEKRAILEEEQRLKALLTLEKVTVNGKADRIVAERALKQRRSAQLEHRRDEYKDSLTKIIEEEKYALMHKHDISPSDTNPTFYYVS